MGSVDLVGLFFAFVEWETIDVVECFVSQASHSTGCIASPPREERTGLTYILLSVTVAQWQCLS
jgi:hypothetical protein